MGAALEIPACGRMRLLSGKDFAVETIFPRLGWRFGRLIEYDEYRRVITLFFCSGHLRR